MKSVRGVCCLGLAVLASWTLVAGNKLATGVLVKKPGAGKFVIVRQSQVHDDAFGMVMGCPAHAHGTPKQAIAKLKRILRNRSSDLVSTIWVCRANQMHTVKRFAPLVDRVVINPFVFRSKKGLCKDDLIWPTFDHPQVNYLREVRKNGAGKALLACINVDGEPSRFARRAASFEEVKWMAYAAIGAHFQGVVWRGDLPHLPWLGRLKHLESLLQAQANGLGAAEPVKWVTDRDKKPISALCSERSLFVVLLSPEYLAQVDPHKTVVLPLTQPEVHGRLVLAPPAGTKVMSAKTLSGMPVAIDVIEGRPQVNYVFTGAGEILIFSLLRGEKNQP